VIGITDVCGAVLARERLGAGRHFATSFFRHTAELDRNSIVGRGGDGRGARVAE